MKDIIATGRVSAVYPHNNTVKVIRDDKEIITGELIVLDRGDGWFPVEGQFVLCIFTKGNSKGFVIGGI